MTEEQKEALERMIEYCKKWADIDLAKQITILSEFLNSNK